MAERTEIVVTDEQISAARAFIRISHRDEIPEHMWRIAGAGPRRQAMPAPVEDAATPD